MFRAWLSMRPGLNQALMPFYFNLFLLWCFAGAIETGYRSNDFGIDRHDHFRAKTKHFHAILHTFQTYDKTTISLTYFFLPTFTRIVPSQIHDSFIHPSTYPPNFYLSQSSKCNPCKFQSQSGHVPRVFLPQRTLYNVAQRSPPCMHA